MGDAEFIKEAIDSLVNCDKDRAVDVANRAIAAGMAPDRLIVQKASWSASASWATSSTRARCTCPS